VTTPSATEGFTLLLFAVKMAAAIRFRGFRLENWPIIAVTGVIGLSCKVKHSLNFRVFETLPMLPSAPADSITNRCKPISNRLTVSRDSTGNSR
jgi:hypothetical protein